MRGPSQKIARPAAIVLWLVAGAVAAKAPGPADLEYLCEDIPPSNYLKDGRLAGISVDLLRSIWKTMGVPEQEIKVVPWARGYETTRDEPGHVLFSMSRTSERDSLFKWVGPIFTVRNVLLARRDRALRIPSLQAAKSLRIGTIKGDVVESQLVAQGFDPKRLEGVSELSQNFEKLRLGRIDALAHSERTFNEFLRETGADRDLYVVVAEISRTSNYYAFNRNTPDALVARFQAALDRLGEEHERLRTRYGLQP